MLLFQLLGDLHYLLILSYISPRCDRQAILGQGTVVEGCYIMGKTPFLGKTNYHKYLTTHHGIQQGD